MIQFTFASLHNAPIGAAPEFCLTLASPFSEVSFPTRSVLMSRLSQKLANSAASGSVRDLRILCNRIPVMSRSQAAYLLPAFYANLDPVEIPQQLNENEPMSQTVLQALEAIDGLYSGLPIEAAAMPDIWPRLWPWITFLSPYLGCFPELRQLHGDRFYVNFVLFVGRFREDESFDRLMGTTPGVRVILAKAWRAILRLDDDNKLRTEALNWLFCFLLGATDASTPQSFAEFVEGAGGSISDLGSLILSHFSFLVPTSRTVLSNWHADLLHASFTFIQKMDNISGRADIGATALFAAMQPLGLMRTITTILCAMGDSPASDTVLHGYVTFLGITIHTPRMAVWIAEGLKHGLLRAILICADRNSGATSHRLLRELLNETLTPSLIYHTVVARMESALLGVNDLARSSRFAKLPEWNNFVVVAEERISLLKALDTGKWASFKACDNIRCGKIRDSHRCSRCSGCRNAYYCSSDCQVIDWQEGSHRDICTSDPRLSLKEFHDLTWHDRAFMRAVLHRDYLRCIPDIARGRIFCESVFPGEPSFVMFSYLPRYIIVSSVQVATPARVPAALRTVEWERHLQRALDSQGKIELHVIQIKAGAGVRLVLVPLRKNGEQIDPSRVLEHTPASTAEYDVYAPTEIH
ncbi:hypothetical protein B0H19DRAFT_1276807 [Mycena capillaripes]|nr:hypothetical protein B0H19DRAFT_1276807 [Mycena capillaripes]